jgi:hypothetical protein
MAILAKVSKPALTPHWQVVKDLPSGGAASVEGVTLLSEAGTTAVTLADGSYNGQMALLINSGASGAKTVTPANMLGLSSVAIANTKSCLFVWVDDGTSTGWAAVGVNA